VLAFANATNWRPASSNFTSEQANNLQMLGTEVESNIYYAYPSGVLPPITGGAWIRIYIPVGFYSNTDLAARITFYIGNSLSTIPLALIQCTVETVGQMQLFRIRDNRVANFPLLEISLASPVTAQSNVTFDYRDLLYVMGFTVADQNKPVSAAGAVSSVNPSLGGEQVVYLHSQQLCGQLRSFSGEGSPDFHVATIPMTVPYGSYQTAAQLSQTPNMPMVTYATGWTPTVVDFQLRNIYNDVLSLPDNAQFWAVVRLWYR
jgi:hypothetical protein